MVIDKREPKIECIAFTIAIVTEHMSPERTDCTVEIKYRWLILMVTQSISRAYIVGPLFKQKGIHKDILSSMKQSDIVH